MSHLEPCPECDAEGHCEACLGLGCSHCAFSGDCELCSGARYVHIPTPRLPGTAPRDSFSAIRRLVLALCDSLRTPHDTIQTVTRLLDTLGAPRDILQSAPTRVILVWHHDGVDLELDLLPA